MLEIEKEGFKTKIARLAIYLDRSIITLTPLPKIDYRDNYQSELELKIGSEIDVFNLNTIKDTSYFCAIVFDKKTSNSYNIATGYSVNDMVSWIISYEKDFVCCDNTRSNWLNFPDLHSIFNTSRGHLYTEVIEFMNEKYLVIYSLYHGNIGGSVSINIFNFYNLNYVLQTKINGYWSQNEPDKFDLSSISIESDYFMNNSESDFSIFIESLIDERFISYKYENNIDKYFKLLTRKWGKSNPNFFNTNKGKVQDMELEEQRFSGKNIEKLYISKSDDIDVFIVDYCLFVFDKRKSKINLLMCYSGFGEFYYDNCRIFSYKENNNIVEVYFIEGFNNYSRIVMKKFIIEESIHFSTEYTKLETDNFISIDVVDTMKAFQPEIDYY